jgi:hypothetical protein
VSAQRYRNGPIGAVLLAAAAALSGCSSIGGLAGAVAGIATGTFTNSPAIGIAVSVSVKAAADAQIKKVLRSLQQDEQDEIAALAGAMAPGEIRPWQVRHLIPYGNNQGEVQVTRVIDTPLASCKEVMFTVADLKGAAPPDDAARAWFSANICLQDQRWKWAIAEPAVERWGSLH